MMLIAIANSHQPLALWNSMIKHQIPSTFSNRNLIVERSIERRFLIVNSEIRFF